MGKAMEAVESQAEASNALGEAAEALAEEEEVRHKVSCALILNLFRLKMCI